MSQPIYQLVTDRILALLQQGVVPWKKPWKTRGGPAVPPSNLVSLKPYRGINVFLLIAQGFGSPYWLTFKQAQARGGHVRRGERGTPIVFWRIDERTEESEEEESASERRDGISDFGNASCAGSRLCSHAVKGRTAPRCPARVSGVAGPRVSCQPRNSPAVT